MKMAIDQTAEVFVGRFRGWMLILEDSVLLSLPKMVSRAFSHSHAKYG